MVYTGVQVVDDASIFIEEIVKDFADTHPDVSYKEVDLGNSRKRPGIKVGAAYEIVFKELFRGEKVVTGFELDTIQNKVRQIFYGVERPDQIYRANASNYNLEEIITALQAAYDYCKEKIAKSAAQIASGTFDEDFVKDLVVDIVNEDEFISNNETAVKNYIASYLRKYYKGNVLKKAVEFAVDDYFNFIDV